MNTPAEAPGRAWPRLLARAIVVLLALQLGAILGLLGGRLLRPGAPPAVAPVVAAGKAPAPAKAPAAAAAGPSSGATVLVDVTDGAGQAQRGVLVVAQPVDERGRPTGPAAGLDPIGELGVLKGRLPLTGEVIAGRAVLPEAPVGPGAAPRAVTDDKGTARLVGLKAGHLQILVSHLGQTAAAEIIVPPGAAAPPAFHLVLRLSPAPAVLVVPEGSAAPSESGESPILGVMRDVSGVVFDERGLPVSQARLSAQGGPLRRTAMSDASGRFTLLALPPGSLTVLCQHPGFAPLSLTLDEEALRVPLKLHLTPGAGVEGVVRERRLGGLPERLQLFLVAGSLRVPIAVGRDGRFRQAGLPAGEATLRAEAPGYVPLARKIQLSAAERPDTVTLRDLVLDMELSGVVVGRLRDGRGPAARVLVRALDERGVEVGSGKSDGEGRFRLGELPAGRLKIEARVAAEKAEESVEIRPGNETQLELELK